MPTVPLAVDAALLGSAGMPPSQWCARQCAHYSRRSSRPCICQCHNLLSLHPNLPASRSITVDDMRVEEMTAAHYLAFKEKLVPMEAGEAAPGCAGHAGWS